jgi:hypothetical protein
MSIGTYGEPDAVSNAIGYAKFYSRSPRRAGVLPSFHMTKFLQPAAMRAPTRRA